MTVVYWQLGILSTIVLSYLLSIVVSHWFSKVRPKLFSRVVGLGVCLFWTVWTFYFLYFGPLVIVQLITIWGVYLVLVICDWKTNRIRDLVEKVGWKDRKIKELEGALKALSEEQRERIRDVPRVRMRLIEGKEHKEYLVGMIEGAKEEIVIISGWISNRVIDSVFIHLLKGRVKLGVKVYIGYGFKGGGKKHSEGSSGMEAKDSLLNMRNRYPEHFVIGKYGTHEKVFVVDSRKVVFGSVNWLSNSRYSDRERSIIIADVELARSEAKRAKNVIREHILVGASSRKSFEQQTLF